MSPENRKKFAIFLILGIIISLVIMIIGYKKRNNVLFNTSAAFATLFLGMYLGAVAVLGENLL